MTFAPSYLIKDNACVRIRTLSDLYTCADSINVANIVCVFAFLMLAKTLATIADTCQLDRRGYTRYHPHKLSIELEVPANRTCCDDSLQSGGPRWSLKFRNEILYLMKRWYVNSLGGSGRC